MAHPVMYHQWNRIAFLHWRYPPEVVLPYLPLGLTADICDGTAWIGLTPFLMDGVRAPGLPAPAEAPLAHASPGVTVRVGMWHRL